MDEKEKNELLRNLENNVLHRELDASSAIDEESRTVELSFSSEEPCNRWFGKEILCHDEGCVDLTRLQEIGVCLFNHNADMPVGKILSVNVGPDLRGHARVQFDEDEESDLIFQKVKSGTLKGVSVGYRIHVIEEVSEGKTSSNGRFEGHCYVATKWEPLEISIVSVPADANVGVGRSVETGDTDINKKSILEKGEKKMDEDKKKVETPAVDTEAIRKTAIEAERARVSEIEDACRSFGIDSAEFIKSGKSIEEVRADILQQLAKRQAPAKVEVGETDKEKFVKAATDGLALRAGVKVEKPADGASSFRGMSMLRLASEFYARETGRSASNMSDMDLVRAVFTGEGAFPHVMADVAHKELLNAYIEAPTTFQFWTGIGSNSDFKPAHRVSLSAAASLDEVKENGEFKHDEVTDNDATAVIGTFGKAWTISRKAIIDDDLGALTELPRLYGAAARRTINEKVYDLLVNGGSNVFSSGKGNLGSSALTLAALAAAIAAMKKMKDPRSKAFLNLRPAFLIVPPELEFAAAQLINSTVDPTKNNAAINPLANSLQIVSDANLTDANDWFLAVAPSVLKSIEVTYLNGQQAPVVETAIDFDSLGVKNHVYIDFGVNLINYRGLYKSSVS